MAFKKLADISSRNVYDISYEQKAVVWLRVAHPPVYRFIVSKVKNPEAVPPNPRGVKVGFVNRILLT